jgi:tripartite-type tricarboxylate transporter receptor subunit TctC
MGPRVARTVPIIRRGIVMKLRHAVQLFTALVAGLVTASAAWAQGYPDRPVRVIVPYAPGGPTDITGRLITQKLSEQLGKQFYIENVGGVGGNIGMGRAAQAAPDGYTILLAASPLVVAPVLYDKVPFDPEKDFEPVTLVVKSPTLLTVHPSVPARSVKELVALINANPGKYSYASPGIATPPHLLGELFRLSLELDIVHVPFNSGGLAIGSAVAGHTPISFGASAPAVPHVKDGKLRALALTGKARSPGLPEVPTMTEAGYPAITGEAWFSVLVPTGTPKDVIALLHREIVKALAQPDIKERVTTLGFEPVGSTPAELAAEMKADAIKWGKVIRDAGIKPR